MLTDSSLTNIFLVSGVSHIRYRVYCQTCKRSQLAELLRSEAVSETMAHKDSNHSWSRSCLHSENNLIQAFRNLMQLDIPCAWRVAPSPEENENGDDAVANNNHHGGESSSNSSSGGGGGGGGGGGENSDDDDVVLELWVFWFDDRHTGTIDSNEFLNVLEETKMGSFTWESTIAKNLSPSSSPVGSQTLSASTSLTNSVSNEYKMFIKSIKRLILSAMVQKGALPLGEFFIFPSTSTHSDGASQILSSSSSSSSSFNLNSTSLISCTYNIYLTNTNLVIQPDVRRLDIRPLTPSDLEIIGTKVITCPLGEIATLARAQRDIPPELEEQTLRQWSLFFDLPLLRRFNHSCRSSSSSSSHCAAQKLPPLVPIRTSRGGNTILYPSALLFVSTASRIAPTSVGGMNGIFGYNQGYTEDLGEKWSRWAWSDQITSIAARNKTLYHHQANEDTKTKVSSAQIHHTDFWDYESPRFHTATSILDTLSVSDTSNASSQGILQKVLSEPIGSSPIMVSKSVATPASSGYKIESASSEVSDANMTDKSRLERFQRQAELCVADFAKLHFAGDEDFSVAEVPEETAVVDDQTIKQELMTAEIPATAGTSGVDAGVPEPMSYMESALLLTAAAEDTVVASGDQMNAYPPAPDANFDFRFEIDAVDDMYGVQNRWGDNLEDLDNLDFDVTEEDFNFFENEPAKPPTPPQEAFAESLLTATVPTEATIHDGTAAVNDQQQQQLMLMDTISLPGSGSGQELNFDDLLGSDEILGNPLLINNSTSPPMMEGGIHADTTTNDPGGGSHLSLSPMVPKMSKSTDITPTSMTTSPATMVEATTGCTTAESHRFVPPDFAPIKFIDSVNDAKYSDGGKFTYRPDDKSDERSLKLKRNLYRPDYIPRQRKRVKRKKTALSHQQQPSSPLPQQQQQQYPNGTNYTQMTTALVYQPTTSTSTINNNNECRHPPPVVIKQEDAPGSSKDDDRASDTATRSSSDGSSSDTSSDTSSDNENDPASPSSADGWMSALEATHTLIANEYLGPTSQSGRKWKGKQQEHQVVFEFDSPFSSSTASGPIRPRSLARTDEDLKVLDYLCQQVVMGGYPFASGLTAVSANGGEIHIGESAAALVTRQRGLTQRFRGITTHTPSLSSDYERIAHSFKDMLTDIFDRTRDVSDHLAPLGAVAVRGPLSVQQYYDLSETSQAQSKYGKYQVKKRRPAEPNLDTLLPPEIVVGRQDELIEGSPKLVTFWEKLGLEPYSQRKNVSYFVVFPSNEQLEPACMQFFKSLSTVYETCHLGAHYPGSIGTYRRGLVPVPLLPASANETWDERQLRSYSAECQNLGSALGGAMVEKMHIVIYLVNPASHLSSYLDLSRCFHKLMVAYHAASMGISTGTVQEKRARLVMQLIPIEHILRPSAFGGYAKFGLRDIAFSVYCKCHTVMGRNHAQSDAEDHWPAAAMMYTPPFVLAKPALEAIQYSLKPSVNAFPTILEMNAMLHTGYCYSLDRRWLIVVWTDSQGEMLEYAVLYVNDEPLTQVIEEVWSQTEEVSQRTGFDWTFVITKMGLMFESELQAWVDCLPVDKKIAITCVDMDSALRLAADQLFGGSPATTTVGSMDYPQTPGSSVNTPTPETFSAMPSVSIRSSGGGANISAAAGADGNGAAGSMTTGAGGAGASDTVMMNETRTLLLNHRVAYSQRRAQVTEGIVTGFHDQVTDNSWMLPLATGYLIQMAQKSENPPRELFNNEPLVMDVHLLYNQTSHSAYSTLRDIIKRYHALSFVSTTSSGANSLPLHLALVERLARILLVINT